MRIRNTAWVFLVLCLGPVTSIADVRVISDIDDTTKITNVGSPLLAVWNGLFSTRSFAGMPELYSALAIERHYSFDYVTGAPEILESNVREFLKVNRFPKGGLHLRGFTDGNISTYKKREVLKILAAHPHDQFILIGDDTQHDFEIYDDIFKTMPDRIIVVYIRKITDRPLPPSAYSFLSAFDIAFTEYLMDRMTVDEISPTALGILSEPSDRRVFPRFSHCPTSRHFIINDPKVEKWKTAITDRIKKICETRNLPYDEN